MKQLYYQSRLISKKEQVVIAQKIVVILAEMDGCCATLKAS